MQTNQSIRVRKKDGSVEDWNYEKAVSSMVNAGIPLNIAENVLIFLEAWARVHNENGIVNTSDIHLRVVELLKNIDESASSRYDSFKK